MPDAGATGVLNWLSEATLAGLCIFILYGSYKRLWYWRHYVEELLQIIAKLEKDASERLSKAERESETWKVMCLQLLTNQRKLVESQPEVQSGKVQLPQP